MQNPYSRYQKNQNLGAKKKKKVAPGHPSKKKTPRSRSNQPKKDSSLPVGWVLLSLVGLSLSFYIVAYTDDFLAIVNRIEVGVSQSMAESGEQSAASKAKKASSAPVLPVGNITQPKADSDNLTMKNANIYKALRDKRRELEKKERRLAQLEEDLHNQKSEIEKQLKDMQEIRRNISSKLDKKVAADQESVNKLVGVYSNMKPQNAALIISNIDDDLAVKVLGKMKKQNAAAILNYVAPQKAQYLSEKFTGLKK